MILTKHILKCVCEHDYLSVELIQQLIDDKRVISRLDFCVKNGYLKEYNNTYFITKRGIDLIDKIPG